MNDQISLLEYYLSILNIAPPLKDLSVASLQGN